MIRNPINALFFISALLVPLACSGAIAPTGRGAGEPAADDDDGARPGVGAGAASGGVDEPGGPGACNPIAARLVKLTPLQVENTARTLMDDDALDVARPLQAALGGIDVYDAEQLQLTANHVTSLFERAGHIADRARAQPERLHPCLASGLEDQDCVAQAIARLGARAYRRPLDDAERERLLGFWAQERDDHDAGVALWQVVRVMVMSPAFQFRFEVPDAAGALDDHALAEALAYVLTDAPPAGALATAAAEGRLRSDGQIAEQVAALLDASGGITPLARTLDEWMQVSDIEGVFKDRDVYPDFSAELALDLADDMRAFTAHLAAAPEAAFADLFTSRRAFPAPPVAAHYGIAGADDEGVSLPASERAGLLTRAGLMALLAHEDETDIISRGRFVREEILCGELPAPPADVPDFPEPDPNLTTRQRLEALHSVDPACASCHRLVDDIGFAFEVYDATGAHRSEENGQPIDASGEIIDGGDASGTFDGAIALSQRLAKSEQAQACFARRLYRMAHGRAPGDVGRCEVNRLVQALAAPDGSLRGAITAMLASPHFRTRQAR